MYWSKSHFSVPNKSSIAPSSNVSIRVWSWQKNENTISIQITSNESTAAYLLQSNWKIFDDFIEIHCQ